MAPERPAVIIKGRWQKAPYHRIRVITRNGPRYGVPELYDKDAYGGHLPIGGPIATEALDAMGLAPAAA